MKFGCTVNNIPKDYAYCTADVSIFITAHLDIITWKREECSSFENYFSSDIMKIKADH